MSYLENIKGAHAVKNESAGTRDAEQALKILVGAMSAPSTSRIQYTKGEDLNPTSYRIAVTPPVGFSGEIAELRDQLTELLSRERVLPNGMDGNKIEVGEHEGSPAVILTLNGFKEAAEPGKTREVSPNDQYTRLERLAERCRDAGGRSLT